MTKIKAAIKLYENKNAAMNTVHEFEERAETLGRQSLVNQAVKYAGEFELCLQLRHPYVSCTICNGDVI